VSAPQILRPDYSRLLLYSNCCCCCWPYVLESFVLIITTIRSDHRTPCTVMLVSFATYTRRQLKIREFHFPNLPLFKQVSKLIWRRAASPPHTHICSCTHLPCARPQFSEDMASWYPPMGTQGGQFFFLRNNAMPSSERHRLERCRGHATVRQTICDRLTGFELLYLSLNPRVARVCCKSASH